MSKFYAVKIGHNPGIYNNWSDCQKSVSGYSGACFKSFKTHIEAQNFLNNDALKIPQIDCRSILYTDGSYTQQRGGYAVVIPGSSIEYGPVPYDKCTNNIAELYAIAQALKYVKEPTKIYTDSEYAINVLTGKKKAHKNLELISTIQSQLASLQVEFCHVFGHKGNINNELADSHANLGRISTSSQVLKL